MSTKRALCVLRPADPAALRHFLIKKNTHAHSNVVGRALDAAVGALILHSSILSVLKKKAKKSVMCALCNERLTWPIDASRGGIARWKAGREMASARALRCRGMWLNLGGITHAPILLCRRA